VFHGNDEILGDMVVRVKRNSCEVVENGSKVVLRVPRVQDIEKLAFVVDTDDNHMCRNHDDLNLSNFYF
jgi:hypothetical protein